MSMILRLVAVFIALAAVIDPVFTQSASVRPPVESVVPGPAHPDHARATDIKRDVVEYLREVARFDAVEAPRARVVIGQPTEPIDASVPVYSLPLHSSGVVIQQLRAPDRARADQQIDIVGTIGANSQGGATSEITLHLNGVPVALQKYKWQKDGEVHPVRFVVPGQRPGVYAVRLAVVTGGQTVHADAVVPVSPGPLRVLVYEARPSWTAAFVRRLVEDDPGLETAALTRSTPRVATTSGGPPASLTTQRLNRYDVLILGGLDALSPSELDAVLPFVSERGGSVILLPDRQVPGSILARLSLPPLDEVLLEEPASIRSGELTFKGSELLLPRVTQALRPLAEVQRADRTQPVAFLSPLGFGNVIFSGALDAWRYRGDEERGLSGFMRSLVADAAAAAPPPVDVSVEPAIARPGEAVTVTARIRATEWVERGGTVTLPPSAAAIIDARGERRMIRLWPTPRRGELAGVTTVSGPGLHQVSIFAGSAVSSAVLVAADDVTHPAGESDTARRLAAASGGVVVEDLAQAKAVLASLDARTTTQRMHPMRSAWWIVPFAGCLGVEWALRRRAGFR